jgi:DNA-binding NarL/FixJ family response regulator
VPPSLTLPHSPSLSLPRKRGRVGWGPQPRPIRVVLYIGDRALRADIADICEGADIAVAAPPSPPSYPPPLAREGQGGGAGEDADVALADRPVETAVPVIALVSGETRRAWPANVRAVVPADVNAATLVAIITVVAAGYALAPPAFSPPPSLLTRPSKRGRGGWGEGGGAGENPFADPGDVADALANALSLREREVLALVAEGASNKEIAHSLALSLHTVKFHVASLIEKLGARSRGEAVAIALRAGLVMV